MTWHLDSKWRRLRWQVPRTRLPARADQMQLQRVDFVDWVDWLVDGMTRLNWPLRGGCIRGSPLAQAPISRWEILLDGVSGFPRLWKIIFTVAGLSCLYANQVKAAPEATSFPKKILHNQWALDWTLSEFGSMYSRKWIELLHASGRLDWAVIFIRLRLPKKKGKINWGKVKKPALDPKAKAHIVVLAVLVVAKDWIVCAPCRLLQLLTWKDKHRKWCQSSWQCPASTAVRVCVSASPFFFFFVSIISIFTHSPRTCSQNHVKLIQRKAHKKKQTRSCWKS